VKIPKKKNENSTHSEIPKKSMFPKKCLGPLGVKYFTKRTFSGAI